MSVRHVSLACTFLASAMPLASAQTTVLELRGETMGDGFGWSVTDIALFRDAYAPLLRPSAVLPTPDARGGADAAERAAQALEEWLATAAVDTEVVIEFIQRVG